MPRSSWIAILVVVLLDSAYGIPQRVSYLRIEKRELEAGYPGHPRQRVG
jgi:hypothetical protein